MVAVGKVAVWRGDRRVKDGEEGVGMAGGALWRSGDCVTLCSNGVDEDAWPL